MFSGRLDLRSSPALARHNWSMLRSALASGRSSDFPQSALPSRTPPHSPPLQGEGEGVGVQWRHTSRPLYRGLQLQVQFRILTGFPFIAAPHGYPIAFAAAKVLIFLILHHHLGEKTIKSKLMSYFVQM